MKKHKYGFTDGSSIVTAGFIVNFYGDEFVGIQDESWTVKPEHSGPFYFDDEEHVETFKEALADAFEVITGDRCEVETIEEQGRRLDQEEAALNPPSDSKRGPEGKTKRNCDWCGVEYFADNRNLKRGWGKCCSKSCAAKKREKNNGHQYANRQRLSDYDLSDSEYWDSKDF